MHDNALDTVIQYCILTAKLIKHPEKNGMKTFLTVLSTICTMLLFTAHAPLYSCQKYITKFSITIDPSATSAVVKKRKTALESYIVLNSFSCEIDGQRYVQATPVACANPDQLSTWLTLLTPAHNAQQEKKSANTVQCRPKRAHQHEH